MSMTLFERQNLISAWIKPSSDTEKDRQDRAERMIKDAVAAHPAFKDISPKVFAKGSYANNTNVRIDSDVDIVVQCPGLCYFEYFTKESAEDKSITPYTPGWTPTLWRQEVTEALVNCFGVSEVDDSGSVAITISEKDGSRPSVDVVPGFSFVRYDRPDQGIANWGSKIFNKSGSPIVNWPQQQLDNGIEKNKATGQRYKNFVRVLKNAENHLVAVREIEEKPSYLMECLVWNVPNTTLSNAATLEGAFREVLVWLWKQLDEAYVRENWEEPNRLQYLFHGNQKWSVDDAKEIVLKTWKLMEY